MYFRPVAWAIENAWSRGDCAFTGSPKAGSDAQIEGNGATGTEVYLRADKVTTSAAAEVKALPRRASVLAAADVEDGTLSLEPQLLGYAFNICKVVLECNIPNLAGEASPPINTLTLRVLAFTLANMGIAVGGASCVLRNVTKFNAGVARQGIFPVSERTCTCVQLNKCNTARDPQGSGHVGAPDRVRAAKGRYQFPSAICSGVNADIMSRVKIELADGDFQLAGRWLHQPRAVSSSEIPWNVKVR